MVGKQYGRLTVTSGEVTIIKGNKYMVAMCADCGSSGLRHVGSLRALSAGCRACAKPPSAPVWLRKRCEAASQRCNNPNNKRFSDYGGRGLEFGFPSPIAMAVWIQDNLGLEPSMEIDRIDNALGYMPGNIRWSTPAQNLAHTRKTPVSPEMHAFKLQNPEVRYADATLARMLGRGMTPAQVVDRWLRPSCKPKGVYGTFSTPDHFIASLAKG